MKDDLILPTQIPWEMLKGRDFEECLYWLIDSIGGKELEWRLGGEGIGAPDQGRDLEAIFYKDEPDGEISRQKWWIETKGRTSTVEPAAVKESILNASCKKELDVLVIATNTTFSNPTRDWVKEWQLNNHRPKIHLWDKQNLERLFSRHPEAVIRLYMDVLTPQGRLEVANSRFWNYSTYSDRPTLEYLWQHRVELELDYPKLLAIFISEIANGNIFNRPWIILKGKDELLKTFGHGLVNLLFFISRANKVGTSENPYIRGLSFLLLIILDRFSVAKIYKIISTIWHCLESGSCYPEEIRDMAISIILEQLIEEIYEACTDDCKRIGYTGKGIDIIDRIFEYDLHRDSNKYWERLIITIPDSRQNKINEKFFYELYSIKCNAGLTLDNKTTCPLLRIYNNKSVEKIRSILLILQKIIKNRKKLIRLLP